MAYAEADWMTNASRAGKGLGAVKYTLRMRGNGAVCAGAGSTGVGVWCVAVGYVSVARRLQGRGGGAAAGASR
jgi:hypothetical protein